MNRPAYPATLGRVDLKELSKFAAMHNPQPSEALLLQRMREKLAENSGRKRTFIGADLQFLSMRITQEKGELVRAVQDGKSVEEVWREAADVANFAAMIALNYELRQAMHTSASESGEKVSAFQRRHGRALYNIFREQYTLSVSEKAWKWFRRLMAYAREIGVRDDIPVDGLKIEHHTPRESVWTKDEVKRVVQAALHGGKAESGNEIPARRSIALATAISYDTSMPQGDVLRLTWNQWDGKGFIGRQQKKRGGRRLYHVVSEETRAMLNDTVKTSTNIIVCEVTGKPYVDEPDTVSQSRRNSFGRLFRKFCKRAKVKGKTFHDLRRTALTEAGNSGATQTELEGMGGHAHGSKTLGVYVLPDKEAAHNVAKKRWDE
ncbi:MAG: tyrosine-type recombinase/integrase [Magnetovibrio sp.]|nr:tyrosine-type recombinase/integrase [Magnetovibrio sp.]